jgi:uncharacterized protein (TIGR02231 family)
MRPLALLAVAALVAPAVPFAASDIAARSRIEAVTVYRSSARVSRRATVELPVGPARVVFAGLPDPLDDDSLRVEGKGSARAKVLGVSVERVTGIEAAAADARAAEERLQQIQDEDRALEDQLKAAQARARLVESLRSTYAEERAKNLALREVSTREWRSVAVFVESETVEIAAETRRLEVARRDLARRLVRARAEVEKVQAKRGQTTKTVTVELEAERAGSVEVALSYAVASAGWQPVWDARLAPEAGTMELTFLGSVWQRTGEDWSGVALSVSTAQPARGLYVPVLEPHYLARAEPPRTLVLRKGAVAAQAAPAARERAALDEAEVAGTEAVTAAQATVEQGLLSATFTAPRRETVDGSGQARKVPLARFPLHAEIVRTAAPRVEGAAFLTAKAVNDTGFPLVAGVAGVYVGDELAGRAAIAATPPGGELQLAFGVDERIEVERKVLERRRESSGLLTKDDVVRYRVRIAVKNRYAAPVAVKLLDLVPVSRDEKIRVALLDGTTAPTREDPERPGVRVWELSLAPREEKAVELRYEIRFPRGFPVAGLE